MGIHYKDLLLNIVFPVHRKGNSWLDVQQLSNTVSKIIKEQLAMI